MSDACLLERTTLCKNINRGKAISCAKCHLRRLKKQKQEEYLEKLKVTQSLIPDGADDLQESGKCVFCGEDKNPVAAYAQYSMGHVRPESKRPLLFGFGEADAEIGSFMMLSLPICRECRRKALFKGEGLLDRVDILGQMKEKEWFYIGTKGVKVPDPSVVFVKKKPYFKYEAKNNG